jgi:IS5 family transposase
MRPSWTCVIILGSQGLEAMGPRHRRPPLRPCVVARLVYLQHTFDLFDEEVVWSWVENPYRQVITGEMYLQNEPLIGRPCKISDVQ